MILWYTHRSLPYAVIIREASSGSRGKHLEKRKKQVKPKLEAV